jgi:hypothetical protein
MRISSLTERSGNTHHTWFRYPYSSEEPYSADNQGSPGPLAVTMLSMLGNCSWFHALQNDTTMSDQAVATTAILDIYLSDWISA